MFGKEATETMWITEIANAMRTKRAEMASEPDRIYPVRIKYKAHSMSNPIRRVITDFETFLTYILIGRPHHFTS